MLGSCFLRRNCRGVVEYYDHEVGSAQRISLGVVLNAGTIIRRYAARLSTLHINEADFNQSIERGDIA